MNSTASTQADQRIRLPLMVEILAAGAGLAAYAYAAGGIVEYLRFAGEDLPAGQAVALLSGRQLLVVGVLIVLMCIPLWLGTRGVIWPWDRVQEKYGGDARLRPEERRTSRGWRAWIWILLGLSALGFASLGAR